MQETNPKKIKAPFLPFSEIWRKADKFRETYWSNREIPVDVFDIIDLDLDMEVRFHSRLRELTGLDALLLGGCIGILLDTNDFMNDRMASRMRYSIAHEIGHYVLHENIYKNLSYNDIDGWIKTIEEIPDDEYSWIEQHAYEFAGRLLVPKNPLIKDFEEAVKRAELSGFTHWDVLDKDSKAVAKEYIASSICKTYGVSFEVITRRLDREGLWPPSS